MPTKTDNLKAAILKRYADFVAAGLPAEWPHAAQFGNLYLFAQSPQDDRKLERAVLSIMALCRVAKMPRPSQKTLEHILSVISAK